MNNKNWSDRADRDLFFTILSVKNIGVISGSEWVTIGNHMRVLGYGFTNEGCRQHFQGLRRAQNKSEQNGSGTSSGSPAAPGTRKAADPTMNPITRRPGPGRGRPKKTNGEEAPTEGQSAAASAPGDVPPQTHDVSSQPVQASNPHFPHHYQPPQQGQHPPQFARQGSHPQWQAQHPPQYHHGGPQDHQHRPQPQQGGQQPSAIPPPSQSATYPSPQSATAQLHRSVARTAPNQGDASAEKASAPGTGDNPNAPRPLPLESENGDDDDVDDDDDDDASDDRPSKRQKTEDEDAEGDGNLEDDPVLALASASNGGSGDPYATSDQFYGEA